MLLDCLARTALERPDKLAGEDDIIGHESELVSRNYTHVDDATKRKAIQNLPNIITAKAG